MSTLLAKLEKWEPSGSVGEFLLHMYMVNHMTGAYSLEDGSARIECHGVETEMRGGNPRFLATVNDTLIPIRAETARDLMVAYITGRAS